MCCRNHWLIALHDAGVHGGPVHRSHTPNNQCTCISNTPANRRNRLERLPGNLPDLSACVCLASTCGWPINYVSAAPRHAASKEDRFVAVSKTFMMEWYGLSARESKSMQPCIVVFNRIVVIDVILAPIMYTSVRQSNALAWLAAALNIQLRL